VAGLTAQNIVIATLQQDKAGVYVRSAVPKAGKFVLTLSANAPTGGLKVGWFVLS